MTVGKKSDSEVNSNIIILSKAAGVKKKKKKPAVWNYVMSLIRLLL